MYAFSIILIFSVSDFWTPLCICLNLHLSIPPETLLTGKCVCSFFFLFAHCTNQHLEKQEFVWLTRHQKWSIILTTTSKWL